LIREIWVEPFLITKVIDTILSPQGILALMSGMLVGYIIGILPAVGQGFALILLMPLAFLTRPEIAFIVYASLFGGVDAGRPCQADGPCEAALSRN